MKKIITFFLLIIIVDTIQAIVLNTSPVLSLQVYIESDGSWVDKGILMDTYYCKKGKNITKIHRKLKITNFSCLVDNEAELNEVENIIMNIKDGSLTKTSATVIIEDYSYKDYTYEEAYRIDKKEDGKWEELEIIGNYAFLSKVYKINANRKLEFNHNWFNMYGELESGEYRLVKAVYLKNEKAKYFSVEFKID